MLKDNEMLTVCMKSIINSPQKLGGILVPSPPAPPALPPLQPPAALQVVWAPAEASKQNWLPEGSSSLGAVCPNSRIINRPGVAENVLHLGL